MSVIDASVIVHALVDSAQLGEAARQILRDTPVVAAPDVVKAEVASAIRRLDLHDAIPTRTARFAIDRIRRMSVVNHSIEPYLSRIWELRANLTVYDAWYVAVAERIETTLVTADQRMASAPGPRCEIATVAG